IGAELVNGANVCVKSDPRGQNERDDDDEHDPAASGRYNPTPTALWPDEPVLPGIGHVARMGQIDAEARAHSPLRANPNAWRNCGPGSRGVSPIEGARTSCACRGSMISKGADRPRRSASQRPMYGMSAQPPRA